VTLRFDQSPPDDPSALGRALVSGPVTDWSGVTIPNATSFEDLHLWLAAFLPGFCKVGASEDTALAALGVSRGWFPYGAARGDSFCYQASRRLDGEGGTEFEFGAGGYGPHAAEVAAAFNEQVRHWDAHGRDLPGDAFAFWPGGTEIPDMPGPVSVFPKSHGTVTASWADAARRRVSQAPVQAMP
jgi:protein-L-isoaspartate(D-aspartate) O-methyltransferase